MNHDELIRSLASHLRERGDRVVWEDMQLGPAGSPRPDVYTIPKTYNNFRPLAFECKVSVADFRRDVTSGKWMSYFKFASGVVFAVPIGLIGVRDLPAGCGLIVRRDDGSWRYAKGATLHPLHEGLPQRVWLKLVIDGVDRVSEDRRRMAATSWMVEKSLARKYGEEIAEAFRDNRGALAVLEAKKVSLEMQMKTLIAAHEDGRRALHAEFDELSRALGLPDGAPAMQVLYALNAKKRAPRLDRDALLRLKHEINTAVDRFTSESLSAL